MILTVRQNECLAALRQFADAGVRPTYRRLAGVLGRSSQGNAHDLVSELVKLGHVERVDGKIVLIEAVDVELRRLFERHGQAKVHAAYLRYRLPEAGE